MNSSKIVRPNELLKRERERRHLSQADVGVELGLPDWRMVSRWERGALLPSPHYRRKLCEFFGKSAKELGLVPPLDGYWTVPFARNPLFTGREAILSLLNDRLTKGQVAGAFMPLALCGMGGVGKTQVALEYAFRHREAYHAVFWLHAESRSILDSEFIALAALLHLPEKDVPDHRIVVNAVKHWLSDLSRWLLIFDGVEDMGLINEYLPLPCSGHILLTTRAQATGANVQAVEVPTMQQEEGISLLLRRAKWPEPYGTADLLTAKELVTSLEGLPLALDQAGAYIEQTQCDLSWYLHLYHKNQYALLSERGDITTGHPDSVSTTFHHLFKKAQQDNPWTIELLQFLASRPDHSFSEETLPELSMVSDSALKPLLRDPLLFHSALKTLLSYSLLTRDQKTRLLTIYPLIRILLIEYAE